MSDRAAQKPEDQGHESVPAELKPAQPTDQNPESSGERDWPLGKVIECTLGLLCLAPFVIVIALMLLSVHPFRNSEGATLTAKERQADRERQINEADLLARATETAR